MKIVEEPFEIYGPEVIEVLSAEYLRDLMLKIRFDNGVEKVVDFRPFLEHSGHPSIRKYLNVELFKAFEIIDGNLNWYDFDLIFPVEDLFKGRIE